MPNKGKSATKRSGNTPHTGARRSQRVANNNGKNIDNSKNSTTLVETAPTDADNGKGGGGSPPAEASPAQGRTAEIH